jgi:5-carboxymethyl-2-hydroxymuconate isomerase
MPHLTLEYSANLESAADLNRLCKLLASTLQKTNLFELGAIRVRAYRAEAFVVADDLPQNAFLDASLRVGVGRSLEDKKRVGEELMAAMVEFFQFQFSTPHFALSLEIREIESDLSWKKNSIHPRLRTR